MKTMDGGAVKQKKSGHFPWQIARLKKEGGYLMISYMILYIYIYIRDVKLTTSGLELNPTCFFQIRGGKQLGKPVGPTFGILGIHMLPSAFFGGR
jgi:predicted metalloprotease with PDZ domain